VIVGGDTSFVLLNFLLDVLDRVGGLHVQGNGLALKSLDKNLHGFWFSGFFKKFGLMSWVL